MSDDKKQIKTFKKVYPQIYSYILPDRHQNDGWQKLVIPSEKMLKFEFVNKTKPLHTKSLTL